MNNVQLMGRLTKDPEQRQAGNNVVVGFTVAVNRDKEHSDFIDCIAWNKTGENIMKYFHKGDAIIVTNGSIRTGSYEGKDGKKVYTTDVNVFGFDFVPTNKKDGVDQLKADAVNNGFVLEDQDEQLPWE